MSEKALRALELLYSATSIGDYVYDIRERELKGWDGPRVTAWGEGARLAEEALREAGRWPVNEAGFFPVRESE